MLSGPSYARMKGYGHTPETASNTDIAKFADYYFEYDASYRVTKETVQGLGCSCSSNGGLTTYTYAYAASGFTNDDYNTWKMHTTEKQFDDTGTAIYQKHVYTNGFGQVMLTSFHAQGSTTEWLDYYRYEQDNARSKGSIVLHAWPSAVSGYDPDAEDLVVKQVTGYTYLKDTEGLIETATYYNEGGSTQGFYKDSFLQRGDTTTPIKQHALTYATHTTADNIVVLVPDQETVYRDDAGTQALTTDYDFTWHGTTGQPASMIVTLPSVGTAQNGPGGTGDQYKVEFDTYGRPVKLFEDIASQNLEHRIAYDEPTGAVNQIIIDYGGTGHLNQTWTYQVDPLGRVTQINDPNNPSGDSSSRPTHVVYLDAQHEVRVYPGWHQSGANYATMGPTQVYRENWPTTGSTINPNLFYNEILTMTATPAHSGGKPTGTESIGSTMQTLARAYSNDGGQTVRTDAYFNVTGLTHAATNYLGTAGTVNSDGTVSGNYWTTAYQYDNRGRLQKTTAPTGTISWVDYDVRNRPTALKVGTTDANRVTVRTFAYDGGGVGDGNLTEVIDKPTSGGTLDRKTTLHYDWRNRLVATKSGVQADEATSLDVQRPISYTVYNNLNLPTEEELYDGDNVTITSTNGVPQRPSSGLLRARGKAEYDNQGRVFQTHVYSVDPSNGAVSANSLRTNVWYDRRGFVMKVSQPGGLVTKATYDGAGRVSTVYQTDGRDDSTYAHAGSVTDDTVLTQGEYVYDANGNVLRTTAAERFDNESLYGRLCGPDGEQLPCSKQNPGAKSRT